MLAAVFTGNQTVEIQEVETPSVSPHEILLEVKACAICGTDIRIVQGKKTRGVRIPSILGHEIAGVVSEVGSTVQGFVPGDHVAVAPVLPCRRCAYCKNNQENVCSNRQALGYEFEGGFAQFLKLPAGYLASGNLFKVPEDIPFDEACLAEPFGCVYNGSERSGVQVNQTVVILGAGPIGLMHLLLAGVKGATEIIVSDLVPQRRALAKTLGATATVDPQADDLHQLVMDRTQGLGADVVILSVGVSTLVNSAMALARKNGSVNLFGGFPAGEQAVYDPNLIHYNEIYVTGTSACTRSQYERALDLIARRKVQITPLISHTFPLANIHEALTVAEQREGIKIVVRPNA